MLQLNFFSNSLNLRLTLVGSKKDEYYKKLVSLGENLDVSNRVLFAGSQSKVKRFYQSADIFILSSLSEGYPNVILEAMSNGLIVIAANVGGVSELLIHGENGYLFEHDENANNLTELLKKVCETDLERLNTLRIRAYETAKSYSVENMVERYRKIYA